MARTTLDIDTPILEEPMELSAELHDLRYANDPSYRKKLDGFRTLADYSEEELNDMLSRVDPDSDQMNVLNAVSGFDLDREKRVARLEERLDALTDGMLIGKMPKHNCVDISFVDDMVPDPTLLYAEKKQGMFCFHIRIIDDTPIFVIQAIHYRLGTIVPLEVNQILARTSDSVIRYPIAPQRVSRESTDAGIIEFSKFLPFDDGIDASEFFRLVINGEARIVELRGNNGFTSWSPTREKRDRAVRLLDLYTALRKNPQYVAPVKAKALGTKEYLAVVEAESEKLLR